MQKKHEQQTTKGKKPRKRPEQPNMITNKRKETDVLKQILK